MVFLVLFGLGQFLLGVGGVLIGIAAIWYVIGHSDTNDQDLKDA